MECPLAALWGPAVQWGVLGLLDTPRRCRGQSSGLQPSQPVPESSGSALSGLHLTLLPQRCGITVPPGRRAPPGLNLGQSRSREQGTAGMVEPSLFLRETGQQQGSECGGSSSNHSDYSQSGLLCVALFSVFPRVNLEALLGRHFPISKPSLLPDLLLGQTQGQPAAWWGNQGFYPLLSPSQPSSCTRGGQPSVVHIH